MNTAPARAYVLRSISGTRGMALLALLIFVAAALVRLGTLERQGLWADEVFSLAMATGHSLEHPAGAADGSLGDFIEQQHPLPAAAYRSYLEHEETPVGVGRVVRAVFLSDTSPPLYYVLLHGWTLVAGTSDAALRWFSLLWALACFPLIWSLGTQLGGRRTAWIACLLFAFAPVAIRYSTEGRMYSMLWFFTLLTAWVALRLHRRGNRTALLLLLSVTSAAGLLTHYFFVFVWGAILAWLLWQPGRSDRRLVALSAAGAVILILPWFSVLPASLEGWRITQDWLKYDPGRYRPLFLPFELATSFFSADAWESRLILRRRQALLLLLAGAAILWRLDWGRRGRRSAMLLIWIAAACLGPLAFDLLRGTYASSVARYALAGLPAAFLLLAIALSRSPRLVRYSALVVLLAFWLPGIRELYTHTARNHSPMREVARYLSEEATEADVVLVHSIPSGMLGIARYMDGPAPIAPWVGQLGQRSVPEDVVALAAGARRVFLVKIHAVGAPAIQEQYLREHALVLSDFRMLSSQTVVFAPRDAEVFPVGATELADQSGERDRSPAEAAVTPSLNAGRW